MDSVPLCWECLFPVFTLPDAVRDALGNIEQYASLGFVDEAREALADVDQRYREHPAFLERLAWLGLDLKIDTDPQCGDVQTPEKAKRLADLIVSEILLYHPSWEKGSEDEELRDRVGLDVERGRYYYARRVSDGLLDSADYYNEAVRSLLGDVIP